MSKQLYAPKQNLKEVVISFIKIMKNWIGTGDLTGDKVEEELDKLLDEMNKWGSPKKEEVG